MNRVEEEGTAEGGTEERFRLRRVEEIEETRSTGTAKDNLNASILSNDVHRIPIVDRIRLGPISKYTKYSKPPFLNPQTSSRGSS
jgi:hypothetical protein